MATLEKGKYPVKSAKGLEIELTITSEFKIRAKIAKALLRLAGWILRASITFEEDKPLQLWAGEVDYVIAESPEEAIKILGAMHGEADNVYQALRSICVAYGSSMEEHFPEKWRAVGMDEDLTFSDEENDYQTETKKVSEWIKEYGKGYFCSTEW